MNTGITNHTRASSLADVLATAELRRRIARPPNYRVEAQAMAILAQTLADRPEDILHVLVRTAVELCGEGTCGISLLESNGDDAVFRWAALAGVCEKYAGGCTPRKHSPCGVTLDRSAPQLFKEPGRYFTYLAAVDPPIVEGLVIPFFHNDECFGTIWIVSHDEGRRFDDEDVRIMTRLGAFTSAGLQSVRSLQAANKAREDLGLLSELRRCLGSESLAPEVSALELIGSYFLADRCCLLQLGGEGDHFTIAADWPGSELNASEGRVAAQPFVAPDCWIQMRSGPFAIRDVGQHSPATSKDREAFARWGLSSLASIPCATALAKTPMLWVGTRRPRDWRADELTLLETAAAQIFCSGPTLRRFSI